MLQNDSLLTVIVIPMLKDNFCYYIYANDINQGIYVDPAEIEKVEEFRADFGLKGDVTDVYTTHKHWDHSGANEPLKEKYPNVKIHGGQHDAVPGCNVPIADQQELSIFQNQVKVKCFHTPCHTKGHILYYFDTGATAQFTGSVRKEINGHHYWVVSGIDKAVFTGDTIFVGGCGRFFEGTAPQMLAAMDVALALPADTKMFCGHEYTMANFQFCDTAEGKTNKAIADFLKVYKAKLDQGICTVPSLLRDEQQYNVFMRCRNPEL